MLSCHISFHLYMIFSDDILFNAFSFQCFLFSIPCNLFYLKPTPWLTFLILLTMQRYDCLRTQPTFLPFLSRNAQDF